MTLKLVKTLLRVYDEKACIRRTLAVKFLLLRTAESRKIVLCNMEKQVLVVNKEDGRNLSDWTKMFMCVETVEPQQSGCSGWKQNSATC